MTRSQSLLAAFALLFMFSAAALADAPLTQEPALHGLQQVRAIAIFATGDPVQLAARLERAYTTWSQLREVGLRPRLVLLFRGDASALIARKPLGEGIGRGLDRFRERGVRMEVCGVDARARGLVPTDFPLGVRVVANGDLSLLGYQNRGFALWPPG